MKQWIWMGGEELSSEQWKRSFETIKEHGIDAVLLNGNEKIFEKAIPIANNMELEIHTWLITLLGDNELAKKHPEWFAVNGLGETAAEIPQYVDYYKWLCPNNPEVQEYLIDKVNSLSKIPGNSGVHLDYIRFCDVILPIGIQPNYKLVQIKEESRYDYCYCNHCVKKFKSQYNIDPREITDPSYNKKWLQFRYDSITNLVNILGEKVRENKKQITAAVFPIQMQRYVRQQWNRWDLDAVFPMMYHSCYNESIDWIAAETKKGINLLGNTALYSGLYIPSIKPGELETAVTYAVTGGAAGVSYFCFKAINNEHWNN